LIGGSFSQGVSLRDLGVEFSDLITSSGSQSVGGFSLFGGLQDKLVSLAQRLTHLLGLRFSLIGNGFGGVGLMPSRFSKSFGLLGLGFGLDREFVGIRSSRFHFMQLPANYNPLKNADYEHASSQKNNRSSEPNHPFLGLFNSISNVMYLGLHALFGYGLCVLGVWTIWRRWRTDRLRLRDALYGLCCYLFAGLIIWHGFIVAQKLLDTL